ncbi:MAG: methyltransferase domain-containing protein [Chloroflexota bacterium]
MEKNDKSLSEALWHIYNRPERPEAWQNDGNLPWNDPEFSERMLREHLTQTHGAASRRDQERDLQLDWFWQKLGFEPGKHLFDVTCGPGLYAVEFAKRGCQVMGIDFSPASIAHARSLTTTEGVQSACTFIEQDVRHMADYQAQFDAALFLYGQLAVFPKSEARMLLEKIGQALKPGAKLCIELLNQDRVDKTNSNWWFTDDTGLWGDTPFLHFGERFWDDDEALSLERFLTLDLQTGDLAEITLCDQTYAIDEMVDLLKETGFSFVDVYPNWDNLALYDADEWIVYVASRDDA